MKFCLSVIKSITSLFPVILVLSSSLCIMVVSSMTIASGIDSSPTLSPAGIGSSFTIQKELANSTSAFKITDEIKDYLEQNNSTTSKKQKNSINLSG